jgi:hypothetical protein
MSSDPNTVILYSASDFEDEGSLSSTAVSPIIPPVPALTLLASGEDTEPFEEEETAPTPHDPSQPQSPLDAELVTEKKHLCTPIWLTSPELTPTGLPAPTESPVSPELYLESLVAHL